MKPPKHPSIIRYTTLEVMYHEGQKSMQVVSVSTADERWFRWTFERTNVHDIFQ
jgi:hypothetical protein